MPPKVSVCIPTYNRRDYLKEALASVFAQTYEDYEVVIVDDGSTDGTKEMLEDAGYNVRYQRTDHIGQSAARNELIRLAQGEYISFLDSDDVLFPDTVERLVRVIDAHGPDVFAYGWYVGMDENGNETPTRQRKLPAGDIVPELFGFIYVKSCGTLCAKRIYEEAGGFDTTLTRCATYRLLLDLSLKYKFVPVEGPTYKKRRHGDNVLDRSFAGRKAEFDVLEDFYYHCGGKDVIPRRQAMKRLSQEAYRAGRAALREGLPREAWASFRQSFRRHPNVKSLLHLSRTALQLCWHKPAT